MPGILQTKFRLRFAIEPARFFSAGLIVLTAFAVAMPPMAKADEDEINWAKERQFWSFRQPTPQPLPAVQNRSWPTEPLDYFILARLERKGLVPAPEAEKRTLIRRVSFDLTGLPPTPEEVKAFVSDKRGDAYERLVDRLLGSPRFGERLASVWLPLARYAEDQAHQVGNDTQYFYPNAFKYREWVINAFNRDLPYDRFIVLQLAADKVEGAQSPNLAALGFVGLGPKYYNRDRLDVKADEWEDRVDTVTRSFLGLTVACARCHDHKFDPITMRDYYGLAGVFASTKMINKAPGGTNLDGKVTAEKMPANTVHIVEDGEAKDLNVFLRGNVERKGPVAERRFLQVLSKGEPVPFKEGSGRKELGQAIADRGNPLTARVMVNRIWGWFFGVPLVPTPSNFGHSGQPPIYPELLDDLAVRFVNDGWSVKTVVRDIVLSSTYRQSSSPSPLNGERAGVRGEQVRESVDSANESLSHMNRRRLTIEQWRDAVLFVCGELQPIGGKSMELDDPKNFHRTVYARISRSKLNDLLMQFDYPDANVHAEKRAVTTTPVQKLFLLNSPFMIERARALAKRISAETRSGVPSGRRSSNAARVERAYQLLFGRSPSREELKLALTFLGKPDMGEMSRWEQYAQTLLASNEMFYVD